MTYVLKLFITGRTSSSRRAIENLVAICDSCLSKQYELEIVDVLEHPEIAESEKIIATPTLLKMKPEPARRSIGDFSDREKVLFTLGMAASENRTAQEGEHRD